MLLATKAEVTDEITVMLVDGKTLVRHAISSLLDNQEGVNVSACPEDLELAFSSALGNKPDVIVYNPEDLGEEEAVSVIERFKIASPDSNILILTDRDDAHFAREMIRKGAISYMMMSCDPEDIYKAIKRAARGSSAISPLISIKIAHLDEEGSILTQREEEIAELVALGHTNKEIADLIYLSTRTVESHRASIMRKLEISSRAELVKYVREG